MKTGRTSGARVTFYNAELDDMIKFHKPHPHPELKRYQLDHAEEALRKAEVIK
ncbi:MAG: hypothetical protein L0Y62_07900 [Nitrospirae bacterium]|nr:hypothetical protein [Nitrospirota bacterium]